MASFSSASTLEEMIVKSSRAKRDLWVESKEKVKVISDVKKVTVEIVFEPIWTKEMMSEEAKLELGML